MARPNKIWFRKDVGWWMVTLGGEKIRLAKGKANKKLAEQKFHELMLARCQNPEVSTSIRVVDLVEPFLDFSKKRFAPGTYRNYRFYSQRFAEACGQLEVSQLKPHHITRWIDSEPWNQTSEGNARRIARRVMTWAKEEGLIHQNPLEDMPSVSGNARQRALTDTEYRALLATSHGCFRILIWALRNSGARPSELYRLKWTQVRKDRLILSQHKTAKKTKKPRTIHMTPPLQRLIKHLRTRSESDYVFVNAKGRPWTSNSVQLRINRIKKNMDSLMMFVLIFFFGIPMELMQLLTA